MTAVQSIDPSANDVGKAQSGSQGTVSREQIEARPIYRTGEVLEAVPGLVVTQHSGEGKANQYFLRGFNLDHGTDLAIFVDGMPVNMRTHAHGQGYADTNFLIPELARGLSYRKGPYYASEGDFASAGAIYLDVVDRLDKNFAQVELGSFGHQRFVTGVSVPVGPAGTLLAAGEVVRFDGPWDRPDELRKLNGVLRYSQGSYFNGFAVTAMAYSGSWYATDQIPQRAVDQGLIGRFGNLDPTDGGFAHRYSLSARWNETTAESATRVNAYVVKSDLALFNNFTYFLNNPIDGDQFKQADNRLIAGGSASQTFFATGASGVKSETTIGVQTRYDSIHAGLFNTKERTILSTVRDDQVSEFSVGVYGEQTLRWTPWLRTTTGIRADFFSADVASNLAANSGSDLGVMTSPKLGLVLGPWAKTELYLNAGTGLSQQRRARHRHDGRSDHPGAGLPIAVPGALEGRRGGRAHAARQGHDEHLRRVPARLQFRDPVRRRCRHHRGEPSEPPHRRGIHAAQQADALALARPRCRLHARPLPGGRPRRPRPLHSREPRKASSAPRSISTTYGAAGSGACAGATSAPGR